ncbi:MAG: squalene/phytoene synthase family protein [Pseudobdellovibrio sp.]
MLDINFYQKHLDQVSRSFAFCIARLPEPLRTRVSLAYLLCRVLDTAEDAIWPVHAQKQQSFAGFDSFLDQVPSPESVRIWIQKVNANDIKDSEKNLVSDFQNLLNDFHSLPASTKEKMRKSIVCMSRGMNYFSDLYQGQLKLKNLKEVNQYCFFVAGIVGELLTDLIGEAVAPITIPRETYMKSHHFGLFLQKINILKDQRDDEKNNKFFIHNKEEFIFSLKTNAQQALSYILSIPTQQKEFRLFCSWSLFIGLSSLNLMQKSSLLSSLANKLPRALTEQLIYRVENIINDNSAIQSLFTELLPNLDLTQKPLVQVKDFSNVELVAKYYQGFLAPYELIETLNA